MISHRRTSDAMSTPTFVFNGTTVLGALPYDKFKQHVDEALARAPVTSATPPPVIDARTPPAVRTTRP